MGHPIIDQQFSAYVHTSLTSDYRPLLTSLTTASKATNQTLTADMLIQAILDKANNKATEKNIDDARENAAMLTGQKGKKGRNSRAKWDKLDKKCGNCKKKGHTNSDCFAPGGGKKRRLQNGGRKYLVEKRAKKRS